MEITAKLKGLHIAPRKVRLVARLVQGMLLSNAEFELLASSKRASLPVLKLLRSAAANAEHNFSQQKSGLMVKSVRVDEGVVAKRFRPRAFGRAAVIRRRTSSVSVVLTSNA